MRTAEEINNKIAELQGKIHEYYKDAVNSVGESEIDVVTFIGYCKMYEHSILQLKWVLDEEQTKTQNT